MGEFMEPKHVELPFADLTAKAWTAQQSWASKAVADRLTAVTAFRHLFAATDATEWLGIE